MRAALTVVGLLVGVALAAAALLGPQAALDGIATTLGLHRLTPLAQPPLGHTARVALAATGLVFGLLLAFILGRLARGRVARNTARVDDAAAQKRYDRAPSPNLAAKPDHAPRSDPELAGLPAAPIHVADLSAEPVGEVFSPAPVQSTEAILAPAPDSGFNVGDPKPTAYATGVRKPDAALNAAPLHSGGPITVDPEPMSFKRADSFAQTPTASNDPPRSPETPANCSPVLDPAVAESLARVEAAVSALALHGPMPITERLDAIDARMGQIAQQIAELAGLARAASRTPLPAPPSKLPAKVRAPGDPALRQSIGTAARALRDRLDREDTPDRP